MMCRNVKVMLCLCRVSRREHADPQIEELNIGEAAEPGGRGTGNLIKTIKNFYLHNPVIICRPAYQV